MRVTTENVRLIGCRVATGADGTTRTYGNLYTEDGELLPFTSYKELTDSMDAGSYDLELSWGNGKNGRWVRCELL